MPIDINKIEQPVSVQLKVVNKLPKNVSKQYLYSVKFDDYLFADVYARVVHFKKKYDKIVYYLYTTKEPILDASRHK